MTDELDSARLDQIVEAGGTSLLNTIIDVFAETATERVAGMRQAVETRDLDTARRAAHALVSSALTIGAARLARLAKALEEDVEDGRAGSVTGRRVDELEGALRRVLERLSAERSREGSERPSKRAAPSRPLVAVVEDDPDNRSRLRAMLEDAVDIVEYATPVEALSGMPAEPPDLVILDISRPGLDAVGVLGDLRTLPALAPVPVLALTAHAVDGDRERFLAQGFDDCLTEPIPDARELLGTIARLLARTGGGVKQ